MNIMQRISSKIKSERTKGFMLGFLLSTALVTTILPVLADTGNKTIKVYSGDVKIVIDGIQQTPTDVTGQEVEPFIYNGTTYLPVRALTNMLTDKNVSWDQDTHTVEINSPSGQTVILDDGRQFYVTDRYGYMVEYECWNNNMGCVEAVHLETCLEFDPVKILMSVKPDQLSAVQEEIRARLPELFTVVQTAPFYLEIIPREINKGDGLKQICRALQIDISETIAFGDSENDIPMLRAAGIGVAMGNAVRAVQETADDVTLSNNEDGIAYYLKRL